MNWIIILLAYYVGLLAGYRWGKEDSYGNDT